MTTKKVSGMPWPQRTTRAVVLICDHNHGVSCRVLPCLALLHELRFGRFSWENAGIAVQGKTLEQSSLCGQWRKMKKTQNNAFGNPSCQRQAGWMLDIRKLLHLVGLCYCTETSKLLLPSESSAKRSGFSCLAKPG